MGKTTKQPYRQSRRFDASCRCHGGCPHCEGNKLNRFKSQETQASQAINQADQDDSNRLR